MVDVVGAAMIKRGVKKGQTTSSSGSQVLQVGQRTGRKEKMTNLVNSSLQFEGFQFQWRKSISTEISGYRQGSLSTTETI